MRKENINTLLIVILFVVTTFAIAMGWIMFKDQNIKFRNVQQKEYSLINEINDLRGILTQINLQLEKANYTLAFLREDINSSKMSQRELTERINDIKKELSKWESVSNALMSRIEQIENEKREVAKKKLIKEVELGEVSVEKNSSKKIQESAPQ